MNEFSYKMTKIKGFICPSKTSLQINDQSFIYNNDNRVKKLIRKAVKADEC